MIAWPDLTNRSSCAELMDAAGVDAEHLAHALRHLEIINGLLGGYKASIRGIKQILSQQCEPSNQPVSLLDVGCGSGDTLRAIVKWARRKRILVQLTGIERCPIAAERAERLCRDWPEIEIRYSDLFELSPQPNFDIVHCALMLHHFSEDSDAVRALVQMNALSRQGIIVNDLHRHRLAHSSIWLLTRMFSRSDILRNDAPLSVARAFSRRELNALATSAELDAIKIAWGWPFRWILTSRSKVAPFEAI